MSAELARLRSPAAVQAALDEFARLGRTAFLQRYGFGKSRDYLVRNPSTGELCDSKAIAGAAYGHQYPDSGPLRAADFSGGEATVVAKLKSLGFEVVRVGDDWSIEEVEATLEAYFEMLLLEARQQRYNKSERNAALRTRLRGRNKKAIEFKHQNVSAVLHGMDLPFISGYKPRRNAQLLLRKAVQRYVVKHSELVREIVDAMEEVKSPAGAQYRAVVVDPPPIEEIAKADGTRGRLPRKIDFASRDESNRKLGRAGEQWVLEFEQRRLSDSGLAELFLHVDWVSDRIGDGAGFDILSFEGPDIPRYIEVKTTNGGKTASFIVSRNELDFSREASEAFYLYRVFQFRAAPALYMLRGDLSQQLHLEPIDYRASFRRLVD